MNYTIEVSVRDEADLAKMLSAMAANPDSVSNHIAGKTAAITMSSDGIVCSATIRAHHNA